MEKNDVQLKRASNVTLASLLNLTVLPIIGFVMVLFMYRKTLPNSIDRYYAVVSLKLSIYAGLVLLGVSGLIVFIGGFNSPMSWIYMISYFVTVHAAFILFATWALVRSWTGKKLA